MSIFILIVSSHSAYLSNESDVESLETQVQARLSLLPSGATITPRRNNPNQNIIHVLVEQLPGSETQII
ncbi:11751_t:CDS:2 [Dentiscutata erythropus]|uniref:11751_t:CDS:1 n=1 Tax=Dentiscutata erythropus TaxID=1348616 RepID=A0A9N9CGG2_9GLOM|nr:11751_t:CDS:2 [Dentiscutata erythropus]